MHSIDRLQDQYRILPSKINRPPLPKGHVAREHLVARLNRAQSKQCISVLAPAGFGKSTLLAEWANQSGQSTLWYSLDELDNDLSRFCCYLFVAVRKAFPQLHSQFFENEKNLTPDNQPRIVRHLVALLSAIPRPSALVLDDCQTLGNPVIWHIIDLTLAQLPSHLCLVLGSRSLAPLGILRSQSSDQIEQFDSLDIRFNQHDTERFLATNLPQYSLEQTRTLVNTEINGWVAGLQLCLINHNLYGGSSFAGSSELQRSERLIEDYLIEEVLKNAEPHVLEFLFATVVCRRFSVELANELTAGLNADLIIDQLQREQLFILPEGTAEPWYRYHSMFRHSLLAILSKKTPKAVDQLHLKAAQWWVTREFYAEAAEHTLASGSMPALQQFLTHYGWVLYRSGKFMTLGQCFKQLPRTVVLQDAPLAILLGWTLLHDHQLELAWTTLLQAKVLAQESISESLNAAFYALQAVLAGSLGKPADALALAQSALAVVGDDNPWAQAHALLVITESRQDLGQFNRSIASAVAAIRLCGAHRFKTQTAQGYYLLASAYLALGNNSAAEQPLQQALAIVNNDGVSTLFAPQALFIAQSKLLSSAAQYDAALSLLDQDRDGASLSGWQLPLLTARLQLHLSLGDPSRLQEAGTHLSKAHRAQWDKPAWSQEADQTLLLWQAWTNMNAQPAPARNPQAPQWTNFASLDESIAPLIALLLETPIRLALPKDICRLITRNETQRASPSGLKIRLLLAVCYHRLNQPQAAKRALLQALDGCSSEPNIGLVESYKNSLNLPLLELSELPSSNTAAWLFLTRLGQSDRDAEHFRLKTALLTGKERAVLTLLAEQLKNDQIAKQLGIQTSTVRSHLKNINRKLQLTGRSAAIAHAQAALRMDELP